MMSFGGDFNSGNNQPMAEINMTPLVDVMLVLLIIFIVTAPLMSQAIKVDLPKVNSTALEQKPETIRISIKADGQTYWNESVATDADIKARMEVAAKATPQPEVHLAADKETRYERIATVMGMTREAGINKFGFITDPKAKQ
jgi:biopolymer transport protein ExbD